MSKGVAARLTIKLPSGRKQSYGAIPGDNSTSNGQSRLRSYATTRIAKESVAALAIESGVLDWIRSEELPTAPSTRKTLTTVESTRPNGDGPSSSNVSTSRYGVFDPDTFVRVGFLRDRIRLDPVAEHKY